jgi:hypothetical protein
VTATLASWLVEAVQDEAGETNRELDELRTELTRLADLLENRPIR